MKVLVGVSVFARPDLVHACLKSITGTPADILVIDNCSPADVRAVVNQYNRYGITTITNTVNNYCNGAWNQIMKHGLDKGYDIVGLGSSDAELYTGWYDLVVNRMTQFPNEILLPSIGQPIQDADFTKGNVVESGTAGFFSFFKREAIELVYPIPPQLKHWFGDEYMFQLLRIKGWKTVIMPDLMSHHQWSAITEQNPEAYKIIEEDKKAWRAMGGSAIPLEDYDSEKSVNNRNNRPRRIIFGRTTS